MRESSDAALVRKYFINPVAVIGVLDTSHRLPMYRVEVGGRHFQLNASTLNILLALKEECTLDELRERHPHPDKLTVGSKIEQILHSALIQNGVVLCDPPLDNAIDTIPGELTNRSSAFLQSFLQKPLLRKKLFTYASLRPVTERLAVFCGPLFVTPLIALILMAHTSFAHVYLLYVHSIRHGPSALGWLLLVGLVYFGVFVHELGHASACAWYHIPHGDIGMAIYVIYPILYSDVTACWTLTRTKRAMVDVAGMYFQLAYSSVFCVLWMITRYDIFCYVVLSMLASILLNLNPFLRFDGYWLLCDIVGFPSLQRSSKELFAYWYRRIIRGEASHHLPEFLDRSPYLTVTLYTYAISSTVFVCWFVTRLIRYFVPHLIGVVAHDVTVVEHGVATEAPGVQIALVLCRLLIVLLSALGLVRLGLQYSIWATNSLRSRFGPRRASACIDPRERIK